MKSKLAQQAVDLVRQIPDGAIIAVGGFGACGTPIALIDALVEAGPRDLWIVSNNCGTDDYGLGRLLRNGQLRRVTASYVGDNGVLADMYAAGGIELELCPQGTLAEKMRAGGSGIPAFYTRTGVGTPVADGGVPIRYAADGTVALASDSKPTGRFGGVEYVLEHAIVADYALVHAHLADAAGNLVYRRSARNFNPLAAMCGRVTFAEAEEIVEIGDLDPDRIHTPGVFVQRVVRTNAMAKRVDRLTVKGEPERAGVML